MKKAANKSSVRGVGRCGQGIYLPREPGSAMTKSVDRIALQTQSGCLALHSAPVERTVDPIPSPAALRMADRPDGIRWFTLGR